MYVHGAMEFLPTVVRFNMFEVVGLLAFIGTDSDRLCRVLGLYPHAFSFSDLCVNVVFFLIC